MSWEMSLVFKATVLLGVALAAVGGCARMRASRRHLIVAAAFAALIALPAAALVMPVVTVPLPSALVRPVADTLPAAPAAAHNSDQKPLTGVAVSRSATDESPTSPFSAPAQALSPSLGTLLRGMWLFGAVAFLLAFAVSLWSIHRLRRAAVPWLAGQATVDEMSSDFGLDRTVTVALHERAAVPATMGVLRPTILLPSDAPQWPESDLRRVLIHELEHVRRGDWWTHLVARTVCALYWFHPLAWVAWRQLGLLAERACDDAVVARMDRADYADQLVTLAGRLSSIRPLMLSMASRSDLSTRVSAILSPNQQRGRAGAVAAVAIIVPVVLLAVSVASLNAVARQERPGDVRTASTPAVAHATAVPGMDTAPVSTTAPVAVPATTLSRTGQNATIQAQPGQATTKATPAPRPVQARPVTQPVTPPASSPPVDAAADPYVIGPDDVLVVLFWRDKDSSGEHVVRPEGKISLPLIGEVQAAGLTPEQLRRAVTAQRGLGETDPSVTVQVKEANSRKVFVVGQVAKPGMYPLSHSMTVLQLLATAGGLSDFARKDAVVITRRVNGTSINIPFDYGALISGQQMEQNILLQPGDTVVVR